LVNGGTYVRAHLFSPNYDRYADFKVLFFGYWLMMKVMVYFNDESGEAGQIQRLLSICEYLLKSIADASVLVISGSPLLPSFHISPELDYIKLPSLKSIQADRFNLGRLGPEQDAMVKFRSDIILAAAQNFKPDILLVDEKPYGLGDELKRTIAYLRCDCAETKLVLLLKDILDHPSVVIPAWEAQGCYGAIGDEYDQVLVMGMQEVFNVSHQYHFSAAIKRKVSFCGYVRYPAEYPQIQAVRQELAMLPNQRLVVVAPDSDVNGYGVIATYLQGLAMMPDAETLQTLIVLGSEMPEAKRNTLLEVASLLDRVVIKSGTDNLMRYFVAADVVVSMGGYDRICEIFSAGTPAVVIPKVKSTEEQFIRAVGLKKLGLLKAVHPDRLTPEYLMELVLKQLQRDPLKPTLKLDLGALPRISQHLLQLTYPTASKKIEVKQDRRANTDRRNDRYDFNQSLDFLLNNVKPNAAAQTRFPYRLLQRHAYAHPIRLTMS
jgi:predicted glycosyltransferase